MDDQHPLALVEEFLDGNPVVENPVQAGLHFARLREGAGAHDGPRPFVGDA